MAAPSSEFAHASLHRSRFLRGLAFGMVAAIMAALSYVTATDNAVATTVGDGSCAASVEGLTVTTRNGLPLRCGILVTAGTGSFTVPAGITELYVEVLGGGGGGGNFGGGGGGEAILRNGFLAKNVPGFMPDPAPIVAVSPGETFAVSVGAGGSGGNHLTAPTNGGDSTFGSFVAKGGGAGGNFDPVTGRGTAGASGGTGGGGAPTAIDEANPAVISGGSGGAADTSAGGLGYAGGAGAGAKSNFVPPSSTGTYKTYLAGGGGGAPTSTVGSSLTLTASAVVSGAYVGGTLSDSNKLWGGSGLQGVYLGVAEWTANRDVMGWVGAGRFGQGGGGGAASPVGGAAQSINPGNSDGSFNTGGSQIGTLLGFGPGKPNANSGQGGGGGGTLDGLRLGSNGGSGLVAIAWTPGGAAAGTPSAPKNVTGSPGTGSVDVSWAAPDSDGGSAITTFGVESSTDGGATWTPAPMCSGTATSCTVTGLTDGTGYVFHVSATNANGTGPWSDPSGSVTPGTGPRFAG